MKRAIALGVALVATVMTAGLSAAGNTHSSFGGGLGATNPCNGEGISATGPIKIVYVEDDGHYVVHFSFKATGVGNQGNTYQFTFSANGQFAEPTTDNGTVSTFELPVNGQAISKGGAPNFEWDLGIRVFVVNGKATGAFFIGPSTTTCH